MNRFNLSTLASAAFAFTLLCAPSHVARAGGEGFSKDDVGGGKETIESSEDVGLGKFKANPWHISVSVRGGYDDNVDLSSFDEREAWFTNVALGLQYNFGSPRTKISLNAGVSATYFFDTNDSPFRSDEDDWAVNTWLNFSIQHRATPRLTLGADLNVAYFTRPGFDTFNAAIFAVDRRDQNFFQTNDKFSVAYAWTPRFATVTSYTINYIDYTDALLSQFEDRYEHFIGNEFRFLLLPTTSLVAEYRFGIVDYVEDNNRNSHSHYFLAGVDHSFSPRFNVSVRGGVEVREFDENSDLVLGRNVDSSETAPYAEATLNYAIAKTTSIQWVNRYALEQPNVPDALSRQTFRTALALRHAFTPRISAGLNVAYQHDEYDQTFAVAAFNEDSFDVGVMLRYAMNRNWAFDLGYQHTETNSDEFFREFSRNQYWAGITWTW